MHKLMLLQTNLYNRDIDITLFIGDPGLTQYTKSFELFEDTLVLGVSLHRETGFAVLTRSGEWVLMDDGADCVEETRAE
jgi:hypothetical protein